eukprot:CAMPEP_0194553154 /NCGR_PEP_ID=MMETSP0253-20130528/97087_1 /TAXON_ID=2966 /ORGANISM="Noctiluca scintillans" /LENGTH=493 /DNA_ID=CAMNT_0039400629 /DNA_START=8 /DNA_END=1489 /DNA_ORIENTATION=+
MEVRLDADEGQVLPDDVFISVRLGDVQKQSRLAISRTYRFPDPGEDRRHWGRLEVFRRVGAAAVNFDSTGEKQELLLATCHPEVNSLRMRISVAGGVTSAQDAERRKQNRDRINDAQKYVNEHRLEECIAEAMREVIRERPENPRQLLCEYLLSNKSPALACNIEKDEVVEPPALPPKSVPPPESDPPKLVNDGAIIQSVCHQASAFANSSDKVAQEPQDHLLQHMVPERLASETAGGEVPADAAREHEAEPSAPDLSLDASVLFAHRPSVASWVHSPQKTWLEERQSLVVAGAEEASAFANSSDKVAQEPQDHLLQHMVPERLASETAGGEVPADAAREHEAEPSAPDLSLDASVLFAHRPSVASWVHSPQKTWLEERQSLVVAGAEEAAERAEHPEPKSESAKQASPGSLQVFPSPAKPAEDFSMAPLAHMPSAGWLQLAPPAVERPWYYEPVSGSNATFVNSLQNLVHEREVEVLALRAKLAQLRRASKA